MKKVFPIITSIIVIVSITSLAYSAVKYFTPEQPKEVILKLEDHNGYPVMTFHVYEDENDNEKGMVLVTDRDGHVYQYNIDLNTIKNMVKIEEKRATLALKSTVP
jgi:hypothetical protein